MNVRICTRGAVVALGLGVACLVGGGAMALAGPLKPGVGPEGPIHLLPRVNSRVITVDGRQVRVSISVRQALLTAGGERPTRAPSVIEIRLSSVDDQPLPDTLQPTRVTLERVKPPQRVVRSRLSESEGVVADPLTRGYVAASLPNFAKGVRLRATVRLETGAGVRTLRMGTLRVQDSGIIAQPRLND